METGTQSRRRSSSSGTGGALWTGNDRRQPLPRPSAQALRRAPTARDASAPDATGKREGLRAGDRGDAQRNL